MFNLFRVSLALVLVLNFSPVHAGEKMSKEEKAAMRAADAELKKQWKADNEQVVVAVPANLTLDQAREAVIQHAMRNAWNIEADHKYQIVFAENMADKNPGTAMFVQALAYDPAGGPMMIRRTFSFMYGADVAPSARVCVAIGQQNRFGGNSQSDCRLPFKTWKEGREKISALFEKAAAEVAGAAP